MAEVVAPLPALAAGLVLVTVGEEVRQHDVPVLLPRQPRG